MVVNVDINDWIVSLNSREQATATYLFTREAIRFGNFTLKTGHYSPVFVQMDRAFGDGTGLFHFGDLYCQIVQSYVQDQNLNPDRVVLFGPAYKGIPVASMTALLLFHLKCLNVRYAFDRKEGKIHGEFTGTCTSLNEIVGNLRDKDQVIIIDAVLTRGDAKRKVITKIIEYSKVAGINIDIKAIVTFVDRVEGGESLRKDVDVLSVFNFPSLAKYYYDKEMIDVINYKRYEKYFNTWGLAR